MACPMYTYEINNDLKTMSKDFMNGGKEYRWQLDQREQGKEARVWAYFEWSKREYEEKWQKIVSCPPLKIPNVNLLLSKRTQTHVLLINNLIHKLKLGNYLNWN